MTKPATPVEAEYIPPKPRANSQEPRAKNPDRKKPMEGGLADDELVKIIRSEDPPLTAKSFKTRRRKRVVPGSAASRELIMSREPRAESREGTRRRQGLGIAMANATSRSTANPLLAFAAFVVGELIERHGRNR